MSYKKTSLTTNQVKKYIPNPTGKGGFKENPQNRSDGRWSKETSISYNLNKLIRMNIGDFESFLSKKRTMAETIAWERVNKAREALSEAVFVTDRTEGKPRQDVEFVGESNGINQRVPTEVEKKAASAYLEILEKNINY